MIQQQIQDKINQAEAIYAEFRQKLAALQNEQGKIIGDFLEALKQRKLEIIKNSVINP